MGASTILGANLGNYPGADPGFVERGGAPRARSLARGVMVRHQA